MSGAAEVRTWREIVRATLARRASIVEYLWVVGGGIAATVGMFAGVRLLTSHVTPEAYGELALAMTVSGMATQLVFGPISSGIARFYATALEDGTVRAYLLASRVLIVRWGLAFSVLTLVGSIAVGFGRPTRVVGLLGLGYVFALVSGYLSFLAALQAAARQRRDVAGFQSAFQAGRYLIALAFVTLLAPTSTWMLVGFVAWGGTVALVQLWRIRATLVDRVRTAEPPTSALVNEWVRRVEAYCSPMVLTGIFTMFQGSADRWSLGLFTGTKDLGLYAVLYQLSFVPMNLVFGTVSQFVGPVLCQRVGDGSDHVRLTKANRWIDRLVLMALFGTACLSALSTIIPGWLIRLAVAPAYREAMGWLPLGVLAAGVFNASQFVSIRGMILPTTRSLVAPKIGGACVGAVCMLVGAKLAGVRGVMFAWLVFAVVQLVWTYLATLQKPIPGSGSVANPAFPDKGIV